MQDPGMQVPVVGGAPMRRAVRRRRNSGRLGVAPDMARHSAEWQGADRAEARLLREMKAVPDLHDRYNCVARQPLPQHLADLVATSSEGPMRGRAELEDHDARE